MRKLLVPGVPMLQRSTTHTVALLKRQVSPQRLQPPVRFLKTILDVGRNRLGKPQLSVIRRLDLTDVCIEFKKI